MSTCDNPLSLCKAEYKEKFWMDDFTHLYKDGKYVQFVPKYEMTRIEQLNAVTRFCIYLIILFLLFKAEDKWLYIPITAIVIVVVMYNINKTDPIGKNKELERVLRIRQEKIDKEKAIQEEELRHDDDDGIRLEPFEKDKNFETGYIDSNGDLVVGKRTKIPKYRKGKKKSLFEVDEILEFQKETARKPTVENPFMNPDITDYNAGDPPVAANVDDDVIKDNIRINFNNDLFRDVDELWERKNSQRQFYTIPNTGVPNNQKEFAMWLYNIPETCKSDQSSLCLRYDPLRFRRK